jgi:hypothetical protein
MKKQKNKDTFDYSPITLRALVRHAFAPAVKRFKDKKRHANKYGCREKN